MSSSLAFPSRGLPFRQLADQLTLILYDHRCKGRSRGAPVESMTVENLTADAEALLIAGR